MSTNGILDQFREFIVNNGVIGTTAGVCVGVITKDLISSLVSDIVVPAILLLLLRFNIRSLNKILPGKASFDFTNFLNQLLSWILIVIFTFIFIQYTFYHLFNIQQDNTKSKASSSSKK